MVRSCLGIRDALVRRGLVVAVLAGVGVLALGTSAGAKEVSPRRYAKAVCGAYQEYGKAHEAYNDAYNALPPDPVGWHTGVQTAAADFVKAIEDQRNKLRKVWPAVDDGRQITKLFVNSFNELSSSVSDALEAIQAADPNAATFANEQATYESEIAKLDTESSDPFAKLKDQDVIRALDAERSCENVVTVIGG